MDKKDFRQVAISANTIEAVLNLKLKTLDSLEKERRMLLLEIENLKEALRPGEKNEEAARAASDYIASRSQEATVPSTYNPDWGWTMKAIYILRLQGEPMTTAEIVNKLLEYEPVLGEAYSRHTIVKRISSSLYQKAEAGSDVFTTGEGDVKKFGLKEWRTRIPVI